MAVKYNYSGPWPIFVVLAVVLSWSLFQATVLDASIGRAIASPINVFALLSAAFLTVGYVQKRRRKV